MNTLFYAGATALLFSFLLMPLLARFLRSRHVLDAGGRRKIHKGFVPSMGGIVITVSFMLAMLLWIPINDILARRFEWAAIALVFFAGIRDDIDPLRPMYKLFVQVVAAGMVVMAGGLHIPSFYGFWGIHELPVWISYSGSIILIVFLTNAFNLIDGIDGLATTIAIAAFTFFGFWFYGIGEQTETIHLICIIGALVGFLYYNWQPASIFMGDTGSLVVGFLLSVATLTFISTNGSLPAHHCYKFPAVLSAGIAVVLLPFFDTLRVFVLRLMQGKSPFLPDKQHLHHMVLHVMQTHAGTVRTIVLGYILVAAAILTACKFLPDWIVFTLVFILCIVVSLALVSIISRSMRRARHKTKRQ